MARLVREHFLPTKIPVQTALAKKSPQTPRGVSTEPSHMQAKMSSRWTDDPTEFTHEAQATVGSE